MHSADTAGQRSRINRRHGILDRVTQMIRGRSSECSSQPQPLQQIACAAIQLTIKACMDSRSVQAAHQAIHGQWPLLRPSRPSAARCSNQPTPSVTLTSILDITLSLVSKPSFASCCTFCRLAHLPLPSHPWCLVPAVSSQQPCMLSVSASWHSPAFCCRLSDWPCCKLYGQHRLFSMQLHQHNEQDHPNSS